MKKWTELSVEEQEQARKLFIAFGVVVLVVVAYVIFMFVRKY